MDRFLTFVSLQINALCCKNCRQFLKGNHKIHIAAHRSTGCLQLLSCTGTGKDNLPFRMSLLDHPGRGNHRRQSIGHCIYHIRQSPFGKNGPGWTTGCKKKRLFAAFYLIYILLRLCAGANIRPQCHLVHIGKSHFFQGSFDLPQPHICTKLSDDCRRQFHIDRPLFHGLDQLKNLGFVRNGAKWTAGHTLSALYTLFIINLGPSQFIRSNGLDTAGRRTRTNFLCNGIVRTNGLAFSTPDTFFHINIRLSFYHTDSPLWTHFCTRMGHTAAALVGHLINIIRTLVTGRRYHLHQRRLIILFRHITGIQPRCQMHRLIIRPQGKSHGQPYPL